MIRVAAAGTMFVLALGGCGLPAPVQPSPEPSIAPVSSPESAFDVACDDVIPLSDVQDVWGAELSVVAHPFAGANRSWAMQGTALIQDGALVCAWGLPDQVPQVVLLALPDAANGYERSEPSFLSEPFSYSKSEGFDGLLTSCRDDSELHGAQCHWNVLAGDVWLSLFVQDIPDDEFVAGLGGAIEAVVDGSSTLGFATAAVEALSMAERREVVRGGGDLAPCTELSAADVAEVLDIAESSLSVFSGRPVEGSMGRSTPEFGQVMWAYSYERLGYTECGFATGQSSVTAMVAPGGAWVLSDERVEPEHPSLVDVEGFGMGVDWCVPDILCAVAVAHGTDLLLVEVAPDGSTASDTARTLVGRLAEL